MGSWLLNVYTDHRDVIEPILDNMMKFHYVCASFTFLTIQVHRIYNYFL